MSAQNVDLVRRALALMSASPEEIRAAAAEFWDPDADYYPARKFPEAQPSHGLQNIAQSLTRIRETWSHYEWVVEELLEVGDDRVLACSNVRAEGRESGMKVEGGVYQCIWLRRGRILRLEDHLTLSGALYAFGLEGDTLEAAGLRKPSNLGLVRSICEAWGRGDYSSADWAHPDIEFVMADGPTPGRWIGHAGMAEGWRTWLGAWEDFHQEAGEYRELDDERVLVLFRFIGRGKISGLDLSQVRAPGVGVFHVRDGKVTRFVGYHDPDRAFADLGLAPEADSSRA